MCLFSHPRSKGMGRGAMLPGSNRVWCNRDMWPCRKILHTGRQCPLSALCHKGIMELECERGTPEAQGTAWARGW